MKKLWNYRHLILKLAISDFKLRYKNSILWLPLVSCRTSPDADSSLLYFHQSNADQCGTLPAFPAHGHYFLEHVKPRNFHELEQHYRKSQPGAEGVFSERGIGH